MAKTIPEWTDELRTGDREIDTHHRALFQIVKRLAVAAELGRADLEVDTALTFLTEYGKHHFATEDQWMVRLNYPYIETHRAAHRAFVNQIADFHAQLNDATRAEVAQALVRFASDWFDRHVKLVDMPLIEFLRGQRQT